MKCLYCDCQDTRVIDSRDTNDLGAIRRRRQCVACSKRFTTYERAESLALQVVKRDGRMEDFDRDKLEVGVLKACAKRPIARDAITTMLDDVEEQLRGEGPKVKSARVGELVLEHLRALDEMAYIRFASVYKSFKDARSLQKEVLTLIGDGQGEDEEIHRN
ncbi:MAG: transcriptional regulator NrdR [Halobacteriales archaeon]|nr:transcriptional regulator NrdR [Halobacteriales archaeon]